jgi:hypothetical protein
MSDRPQPANPNPAASADTTKLRYDRRNATAVYVNAIHGSILPTGEFALDCGMIDGSPLDDGPPTVPVNVRLVCNVFLVQDLARLLHELLLGHARMHPPAVVLQRLQAPAPPAAAPPPPENNGQAP